MKKILICGSHFTSAHAVIEKLIEKGGVEISYVGRLRTMEGDRSVSAESKILPEMGIKFYSLTTGRFSRSLSAQGLLSLFKIPVGFWQAFWLIKKINPVVVLSFGGYISVPVVIMAKLMRIKVMLHEQTLLSGLSNKICGLFADKIAVSYAEGKYDFDKNKMVLTGNPIRAEIINRKTETNEIKQFLSGNRRVIFITGGNQGAQSINKVIASSLEGILDLGAVIWQTGDSKQGNFEMAMEAVGKSSMSDKVLVKKWFNAGEVGQIMRGVDVVVCRGGINTLNELAYFKRKAIVIPYPYLYRDEQLVNARYFEALGLARVILQEDLTPQVLMDAIKEELSQDGMTMVRKDVIVADAADRIVRELFSLISE